MSVRGVWVIRPPVTDDQKKGKVLFSRRYPTVERRARLISPTLYYALPHDNDICDAVMLKCSKPTEEVQKEGWAGKASGIILACDQDDEVKTLKFVEERDSCALPFQKPVYELFAGKLWPVVCIEKNALLFVAAPLVEARGEQRPPLIEIPGIPAAIALLEGMADILSSSTKELTETSSKLQELYQYMCLAAPFGTPMDTNPTTICHHLQYKGAKPASSPKLKQPSWRPMVYRGSSRLQLTIREEIKAVQYDKQEVADVWELYGTIQCKAELEGHPDIHLTLTTPPGGLPLDHLVVHPCVQSADVSDPSPSGTAENSRKIRFSAPLETFTLCHYQVSCLPYLPIRGFYQMKGDKTVKLLMQLKLNEGIKNSFEYCEVHMPFFHRGPIDRVDNIVPPSVTPSLILSQDRRTIIWNIGQKFPSKTLEMSLQATVYFPDHLPPASPELQEDPFCVGLNSYADVVFKIPDFTTSGCNVDGRSITLFPNTKYKLSVARELCSVHYRIWNSHGDVIAAFSQSKIKF